MTADKARRERFPLIVELFLDSGISPGAFGVGFPGDPARLPPPRPGIRGRIRDPAGPAGNLIEFFIIQYILFHLRYFLSDQHYYIRITGRKV